MSKNVALALMVHKTLQACEVLTKEGLSVELIDPRTVAPLDVATILNSVAKTGRLLVVDESFGPCGIGAEIAAEIADRGFDELDAPIRRLNGAYSHINYRPSLEHRGGLLRSIERPACVCLSAAGPWLAATTWPQLSRKKQKFGQKAAAARRAS